MHIPKTAGMSMRLYSADNTGPRRVPGHKLARYIRPRATAEVHGWSRDISVTTCMNCSPMNAQAGDSAGAAAADSVGPGSSPARPQFPPGPSAGKEHDHGRDAPPSGPDAEPAQRAGAVSLCLAAVCPGQRVSAACPRGNTKADAADGEAPPNLELAQDRLASIEFVGLTEDIGAVCPAWRGQ